MSTRASHGGDAPTREPTYFEISRANTVGTNSAFMGLVSSMGFLFGIGLVLGPWAVLMGRDALKLDPGAPNARAGIALGVLGFLLSLIVAANLVMELLAR